MDRRPFLAENGWFLFINKVFRSALHRTRDRLIARRLGTTNLRMGHHPRLIGLAHLRLGESFSAGDGLWIEAVTYFAGVSYSPMIAIGDRVNCSNNVHVTCTRSIVIESGVLVGSNVVITDHNHGRYQGVDQSSPFDPPVSRRLTDYTSVLIGRNVWIGDGVAVLGGSDIGSGAIIGANSVVNGTIPANCIAVGAPARPVRRWEDASQKWVTWDEAH